MTDSARVRPGLAEFVRESNRIEGILRKPTKAELAMTEVFLALRAPTVLDVESLVRVYQPDALLRCLPGLNVRVGDHIAPPGGPAIIDALRDILARLPTADPWSLHVEYETLHPFTDGNGRSGRALWAWQMVRRYDGGLALGFLHRFYYQTLAGVRLANPGHGSGEGR